MNQIVLGTHIYPAKGDAEARMRRALDAWADLPGVRLVNLQFADDPAPVTHQAFETRAALREDSRTVTGVQGPRKPTMRELSDRLGKGAEAKNCAAAGFSNAAIAARRDRARRRGRDAVISRGWGSIRRRGAAGEFLSGQDTCSSGRCVPRAAAAPSTSSAKCLGRDLHQRPADALHAELVNRGDDCRHVDHETIWVDSPFARTPRGLAHMDWTYFARCCATTIRRRRCERRDVHPPRKTPCATRCSAA